MKKLKSKIPFLIIVAGLLISCKKNEIVPTDNYNDVDSTETTIDSVDMTSDTTITINPGTTGATGEGSTGSGSAGTTQKGNTSVRTDSTATSSKGK